MAILLGIPALAALGVSNAALAPTVTIVEFQLQPPDPFPTHITAGPDGNLWFTEADSRGFGTPGIGRIAPTGATRDFGLATSGTPWGIALGADGNLWFTLMPDRIGRITPSGVVREFLLPTADAIPREITAGPDGALWFTEAGADQIGRITLVGVTREFRLPAPNSGPEGITTGPDGNLWFTEFSGDRIGRMTPTGVVAEFALSPGSQPLGITTGPDGNLWFTEFGAGRIGRMTRTGVLAEFRLPVAPAGGPVGITAGPDGNLWFTLARGAIGRITPLGVVTLFAVPTADSQPFGIARGPAGTLWFTERAAGQIGRATLPPVTLTVGKTGTGRGTVTSSPPGIACGRDCAAAFPAGTIVRLTAQPDPGSTFAGWSGNADCADGVVELRADTRCTARFLLSH